MLFFFTLTLASTSAVREIAVPVPYVCFGFRPGFCRGVWQGFTGQPARFREEGLVGSGRRAWATSSTKCLYSCYGVWVSPLPRAILFDLEAFPRTAAPISAHILWYLAGIYMLCKQEVVFLPPFPVFGDCGRHVLPRWISTTFSVSPCVAAKLPPA